MGLVWSGGVLLCVWRSGFCVFVVFFFVSANGDSSVLHVVRRHGEGARPRRCLLGHAERQGSRCTGRGLGLPTVPLMLVRCALSRRLFIRRLDGTPDSTTTITTTA